MADESSKSFWATMPGILTGAAALISAVVGLLAALERRGPDPKPNPEPPPIVTEAPEPVRPEPIEPIQPMPIQPEPIQPEPILNPQPAGFYTDRCMIEGESVLVTSAHLVLSEPRGLIEVGRRVPPLHPDCSFDIVTPNGSRYCVQAGTGQVFFGTPVPVGQCFPCPGGVCG